MNGESGFISREEQEMSVQRATAALVCFYSGRGLRVIGVEVNSGVELSN
jgi:hypothetical protein